MTSICETCRHFNIGSYSCRKGNYMSDIYMNNSCTDYVNLDKKVSMDFKRDFYTHLVDAVNKNDVTFLFGPRHCGKTYAMKQMNRDIANSEFIDIKLTDCSQDSMLELLDRIRTSHQNNQNIIYLVDEVTYLYSPEMFVSTLYEIFNFSESNDTRVLLTGSQSVALRSWEGKYFCGCCGVVEADFMNYAEWLRYKQYDTPTATNYFEFLITIHEFYKLGSVESYLEGCLDETVRSNLKAYTAIRNNSADGLTAEVLLDILFCALVNVHIGVIYNTFTRRSQLESQVKHFFSKYYSEDVKHRLADVIISRYSSLAGMSRNTLRNALVFLYRNSLIGFTWKGTKLKHIHIESDIMADNFPEFSRDDNGVFTNYKQELFDSLGIYIKHPMFYVGLLQLVFKDDMPDSIPNDLLGDIVECHVRSLLPSEGQYVYHEPVTDREVDYVNDIHNLAVEITVSDKHGTCFELLPETHNNILLSATKDDTSDKFTRIPYYKYIYNLAADSLKY